MTEVSYFWDGDGITVIGDDSVAPYTDDTWSDVQKLYLTSDNRTDGLINTSNTAYSGEFGLTINVGYVTIGTGAGIVDGKIYVNSSVVSVVVTPPVAGTRYDRIVLRKSWAGQTVRITKISGTPSTPAIVQSSGTTWDIRLYVIAVTSLGIITLVKDERVFARSPLIEQNPQLMGGRLTTDYNNPYTSYDLISSTGVVYYVPYAGKYISLWDTSNSIFRAVNFATTLLGGSVYGLSITGLTTINKMYDIFAYVDTYNNPSLEAVITTRVIQLNKYNGVYCKTSDETRRYLGSVYVDSSGNINDTLESREVWNMYNRCNKSMYDSGVYSHSYLPTGGAGTVWRNWDGGSSTVVKTSFVSGDFQEVNLSITGNMINTAGYGAFMSVDFDGGITPSPRIGTVGNYGVAQNSWLGCGGSISFAPGRHYTTVLEGVSNGYTGAFESAYLKGMLDC